MPLTLTHKPVIMNKLLAFTGISYLFCFLNTVRGFVLPHSYTPAKSSSIKSNILRFATVEKTDEEWKEELSPEAYNVLIKEGTEPPFTSYMNDIKESGTFYCRGCNQPLFRTRTKFDSGSGWPSFYSPLDQDAISLTTDYKLVLPRSEVRCSTCDGHLGHVFDDGPNPTGQRYCVNGVAMTFRADESEDKETLNVVLERESNASNVKPPIISVIIPSTLYTGLSFLYFKSFISRMQVAQGTETAFPSNVFDLLPLGIGIGCVYLAAKGLVKLVD